MKKLLHVKSIKSESVGGGNMVDFIELNSGILIGVNDAMVAIYKSMSDFDNCEGSLDHYWIETEYYKKWDDEIESKYMRIKSIYSVNTKINIVDFIILKNDIAIGIDVDSICVYSNFDSFLNGGEPLLNFNAEVVS